MSENTPKTSSTSRRNWLKTGVAASAATFLGAPAILTPSSARAADVYKAKKGNINQSLVHWCYAPHMSVEAMARLAVRLGCKSIELAAPKHWPVLKKHGLVCAISGSHGFAKGFAHKEEHAECIESLRKSIDLTADAGFPNVITFSGMRRGLAIDECQKNMVAGLKKIVGYAEKKKVDICLEMLNSKVDESMKGHPDYMCDKIEYAVEVCEKVGSERMKILFDVYHVQIMQGDVIRRIQQYHQYVSHYHTAGNPGRGELDNAQEINYPGIMKAIAATGYKGHVGQEFIPTRDATQGLSEAVKLCDV